MANKLSINDLKTAGQFVGQPELKTIAWSHDGEDFEADVYVRKLSYKSAITDALSKSTEDILAARIAACVCDAKGQAIFTAEDIKGEADKDRGPMASGLFMALSNAVGEANGATVKTKSPQQKKSSGTN